MASTQYLIAAILTIVAAVLVLWAGLGHLVTATTRLRPRPRAAGPASAPGQCRGRSGHPGIVCFLRTRLNPTSFAGLPLTLICLAGVVLALLGGLIETLRAAEGAVRLDQAANAFFSRYRAPWLLAAFLWITALGAGPAVTAVVCTASALLWSHRRTRVIVPLWITFLGAQGMTWAGKYVIHRARPIFLDGVTAASPSFPSGHATAATALFGFLAYVIARDLPTPRQRFEVAFWTAILIGLVCFSRIFLSLHYLSDVAGGVLVGTFWLLVGFATAELRRAAGGEG